MRSIGQLCLLIALVCSAYPACINLACRTRLPRLFRRIALACAWTAFLSLSGATAILARALLENDFEFDYVAHYSSRLLPWQYSLAALWVGQGGSLLLWAWMLSAVAVVFRLLPTLDAELRASAFGVLQGTLAFLVAVVVFGADPLKASLGMPKEGLGLSPLLQHPKMLIHPPVIFFAYTTWTVPFAVAIAALVRGRLDATWTQIARPWALLAWTVLLAGLLLGAHWAYQELGWGGYWGWDPVENGSLLPWLAGTALIHSLMAWRHRDCLKKTAVALAIGTFALCIFATFLTRSGIFSSVHAFSQSPIGWMFLGLMGIILVVGLGLVVVRRAALAPGRVARSFLARETLVLVSTFLLLVLTAIVMAGTLVGPVSTFLLGRTVVVEPAVYDKVLIPVGVLLLAMTALVPLLRWGEGPGRLQRRALWLCGGAGLAATGVACCLGARGFVALAVAGLSTLAVTSIVGGVWVDVHRRRSGPYWRDLLRAVGTGQRPYAGYIVHLGIVCLAMGITGSALGSRRHEAVMSEGETIRWAGWQIRYAKMEQRELPDKLIAEAVLEVECDGDRKATVRPARHLHLLQNEWTTEVDIHSTWGRDLYTVLDAGLGDGKVALTFVENPMMRWIWLGGCVGCLGALMAMWPRGDRRRSSQQDESGDEGADRGRPPESPSLQHRAA